MNLLGQNVNAYRGATYDGDICSFSELLRLVAAIDGIDHLRFTTSHPIEFTDDIIDVYRDTPELVSFLHLPVQSGSDRILTMMKRAHTALEYKAIIRKLRQARPDIQISSDFIIGFPGETQQDFEQTMKLVADIRFDTSYSFIYSSRPGTPSMIGKFVDVEIIDVYASSLRGILLHTEDQMDLRVHESPQSVIARTRKENEIGVGQYQP